VSYWGHCQTNSQKRKACGTGQIANSIKQAANFLISFQINHLYHLKEERGRYSTTYKVLINNIE